MNPGVIAEQPHTDEEQPTCRRYVGDLFRHEELWLDAADQCGGHAVELPGGPHRHERAALAGARDASDDHERSQPGPLTHLALEVLLAEVAARGDGVEFVADRFWAAHGT